MRICTQVFDVYRALEHLRYRAGVFSIESTMAPMRTYGLGKGGHMRLAGTARLIRTIGSCWAS